ncbi:MAG: hypothetical protein HDS14_03225 [Bacteroides sp.]|nr:hypothetical protein [Bacteroides sp.]
MRQLIILFLFFFLLGACNRQKEKTVSNDSQIKAEQDIVLKREVLGVTLGETSKDSALLQMKQLGYNMDQIDRDIFVYNNPIRFGEQMWDFMSLITYQNKVRKIQFVKIVNDMESFYNDYDMLSSVLKSKYHPLIAYEDTASVKSSISFIDNLTSLNLQLDIIGEQPAMTLTYDDVKLDDKYNQESYNEL